MLCALTHYSLVGGAPGRAPSFTSPDYPENQSLSVGSRLIGVTASWIQESRGSVCITAFVLTVRCAAKDWIGHERDR